MNFVAKPVKVEAHAIVAVRQDNEYFVLNLDDDSVVRTEPGMTARMTPSVGDYWVIQSDGYIYLNPKEVFERKYRPDPPESEILTVVFNRLNLRPDGEIEQVELSKAGQRISLTKEQAFSLSNQIVAKIHD